MDNVKFSEATDRLYLQKAEQLEQIEREFLMRLYHPSRNIGNETQIEAIRIQYLTTFRTQVQNEFRIFSQEIATLINNTQDHFMQQYNVIVARTIAFDRSIEATRKNLLFQYNEYYERHYPDAPILRLKTAAVASEDQNQSSNSHSNIIPQHTHKHHEEINDFFRNIRVQVERENEALAERMANWIQSNYIIIEQQEILFSHCIRHATILDARLRDDLAMLRKSAQNAGMTNDIEEQLSLTLQFAREARANLFNTLKRAPGQLAAFNMPNIQPVVEDELFINELNLGINTTAPVLTSPRLTTSPLLAELYTNKDVLIRMDDLDIPFSPEAYYLIMESMGHIPDH